MLALTIATVAWGQNTGRISGSVVDATGAAVPAAKVELFIPGGASAILSTETNQEGLFLFSNVQPVNYDLSVDAKGFRKEVLRGLKVNAGLELSLPAFKMQIAQQAEVVEVSADLQGVQTANAEVASVITNEQIRRLPTLNRSPLALISTQAGVGSNNRTNTTINGMRPSFANVTIDGINIQDNFIRTNALDFMPNMLLMDQVGEMTVSTSNSNAAFGSGAAQVTFVTPSGTNQFHGSAYWYNRNNIASANEWFNNQSGVDRPFLNQNQLGGSLGGPVIKDKLFFFGNYEALRLRQQTAFSGTVLTDSARNGVFTYTDTQTGQIRSANVLQLAGVSASPEMQQFLSLLPSTINRTDIGDGLNTGGYGLNRRDNRTRDNVTVKVDYIASTKHIFSSTLLWNRDNDDRPDADEIFTPEASIGNDGSTKLWSGTWRWNPVSNFTNELRGGFNLAPGLFNARTPYPAYLLTVPLITNPVNTFMPQGRYTDTYNVQNNSSWFKGKHSFQFGFQYQRIKSDSFDNFDVLPTYTIGISTGNTKGLLASQLPGISANDLTRANQLLALQAGYMEEATQAFNITSINSGFVPGAENLHKLRMSNYAGYFNDTWRMSNRLTLTMGVRWEFYTPVTEARGLALLPRLENGNAINTLLNPNGVLDFAGTVLKRPWYNKDWNNFGPNVGLAWQPFGDGKTVIRAGYSVNYPNDDFIRSVDNNVYTNSGLNSSVTLTGLTNTVGNRPAIGAPEFVVPRTFADNYALDPGSAFGMPDPNLRIPYVQQWNFGIQREIAGGVLEARYVGNRATKQFRAFDYNQVLVREDELPGYLSDFNRAYSNGNLAQAATGTFNPNYNPNIAGSQQLTFFPQLPLGGLLNNATIRGLIQRGEVGQLATIYQTNGLNGDVSFFRNPNALGTNMMTNYSSASYHSGQVDYRRTFRSGVQVQANYTFAKGLSDAMGSEQSRFEPFLDLRSGSIERARTPFDLTHSFKVNGVVDLPFGKGRRFNISNPVMNQVFGGWQVSAFMTWQSGSPFSVLSTRGTLNRGGNRSAQNTAVSIADGSALDEIVGFRMTPDGPMFIADSAINPADGRGVAADGRAPFSGQVFFNPSPGQLGTLQRRMFTGPSFWNTDMAILKTFHLTESGHRLEFRSEWFNFTNTPSFYIGDQNVNSTTFGRITDTASSRRIIQFGLYYRF